MSVLPLHPWVRVLTLRLTMPLTLPLPLPLRYPYPYPNPNPIPTPTPNLLVRRLLDRTLRVADAGVDDARDSLVVPGCEGARARGWT